MTNALPTYDALMNPLLDALRELGGSGSIEEIYAKTVEITGLSEDVVAQLHDPEKVAKPKSAIALLGLELISGNTGCWKTQAAAFGHLRKRPSLLEP